jgi:hypothetical protein
MLRIVEDASARLALLAVAGAGVAAAGCGASWRSASASIRSPSEAVILSQRRRSEKIIGKISAAGPSIASAKIRRPAPKGVTPSVISYMQRSHDEAVKAFPKLADDADLNCWPRP